MDKSLKRFVRDENIKNFRKQLDDPTKDSEHALLKMLLAEEEAKGDE